MLKFFLVGLVFLGGSLLIIGIIYKSFKFSKGTDNNTNAKIDIVALIERITAFKIISIPLELISKDKKILINRFGLKILELGEVGISLKQLYFLKFLCLIFSSICLIAVSFSNINYKTMMIIETYASEKTTMLNDRITTNNSKYKLYRQIDADMDYAMFSSASYAEQHAMVEEAVSAHLDTSDAQILDKNIRWFMGIRKEVEALSTFKLTNLFPLFFTIFIPEACFILRWLIRGTVYKREIIKLEYIFELLASVEGVKTIDIVFQLERSSNIYSKYLKEFSHLFKYDKIRAFNFLKSRNIKSLAKMANILEIYSLTDRDIALQILDREVMERDEAIIITADETVDFIDLVAFLSIAPLIYEVARLMLSPMLDMIYKAFEFI
jgi:ribosomal protein S18